MVQTFNQLSIALQVWNLVQSFFISIFSDVFLGTLNFEFFPTFFFTFQKSLGLGRFFEMFFFLFFSLISENIGLHSGLVDFCNGGSMVPTFNQLPVALQVWNLVQSFFTSIYRIFSHFFDFSKITRSCRFFAMVAQSYPNGTLSTNILLPYRFKIFYWASSQKFLGLHFFLI